MTSNSNLIKDTDRLHVYRYQLTELYFLINGEKDEIPIERVSEFKIEHYFEDASFPIFRISVVLEPSRYYKIIKNKKDVKFKVRIQNLYLKDGKNDDRSMLRDVINDTFVFFPEDDDSDYEIDHKKEAEIDKDENDLKSIDNVVELYLFKSIVTNLRSKVNYVFGNIDISTAICYLFLKSGVKNLLMSPVENTTTYKELILPPQSVDKQIKYLNNNYGIHKDGTIVYYGLFHNYLLNYKPACTAWYPNEKKETIIYVLESSGSEDFIDGVLSRNEEDKNYCVCKYNNVSVENKSVTDNVLGGIDTVVVDMQGNSSTKSSGVNRDVNNANSRIFFNDTSNKFMSSTISAQQKANNLIIGMEISNINLEIFNPNKKFSIIFENATYNEKYKGIYKIANAHYKFTRSGDEFLCSGMFTFKKVG